MTIQYMFLSEIHLAMHPIHLSQRLLAYNQKVLQMSIIKDTLDGMLFTLAKIDCKR